MQNLAMAFAVSASALACSRADPTLPHREKLALCLVRTAAPLGLDFDAIPPEMHRMHMGAEGGRRTAKMLDEFLAESPPLDAELLEMVEKYAENERQRGRQFAKAVVEGRPDLTPAEGKIVAECARQNLVLFEEICRRIDFDGLVEKFE